MYIIYELFMCVAELYSYTEGPEFALNRKCFEEEFRVHGKHLEYTYTSAIQIKDEASMHLSLFSSPLLWLSV